MCADDQPMSRRICPPARDWFIAENKWQIGVLGLVESERMELAADFRGI